MCNSVKQLIKEQQKEQTQRGILGVGCKLPTFCKKAVISTVPSREFTEVTDGYAADQGKWMVLFWWPKDFTFVCPTEIIAFNAQESEFKSREAMLVGASTDTEYVHLGWRQAHPGLAALTLPMLADTNKTLASDLGILDEEEKVAYRATFIVDPQRTIRWVCVNDMSVGRSVGEVLRVLDALRTGELTGCNWEPGKKTVTELLADA